MNPILTSILWQSLIVFLFVGSAAGVVLGLLLILRPAWLQSASKFTNRWVSTRQLDLALERSINIDMFVYRYRFVGGGLLLAGAAFILYFFSVQFDKASVIAMGLQLYHWPARLMEALVDGVVLSGLVGALSAAIVSLLLLLRPDLLRGVEQYSNRWVSSRRALKPMAIPHYEVDEAVFRHRQLAGSLLILGSLYTVIMLIVW